MDHDPATATALSSCFWCTPPHPAHHALSVCPACTAAYRGEQPAMDALEMAHSYPLQAEIVAQIVSRRAPGNFALGYLDGATFAVFYLGHSDSDVGRTLRAWVDRPSRVDEAGHAARSVHGGRAAHRIPWHTPLPLAVGNAVESPYTRFAYSYAGSAEAAFEKECRDFDELGGCCSLDNDERPHATAGRPGESLAHSA